MFKKLFKKKVESSTNIKEVAAPCICDKDNEHCNLILQLRKCQDLKKMISHEIEILNKDNHELLSHFIDLLCEFWLLLDYYNPHLTSERNIKIIESTIQERSSADIFRIAEELKAYKNKDDIIREKQRALKAVEDDIEKIKTELGIE